MFFHFSKKLIKLNILFLFSTLLFSSLANAQNAKEVVDKVIAIVNSEAILQSELTALVGRSKKEGGIDEALLLEDKIEDLRNQSKLQMDFLIREKLVESEIKKQNLSVSEDRLNSEMNTMAKRNGMSKEALEQQIKKQGFSISDYKKILKSKIERQSFFENEIVSKLRITDEDAYGEFRAKFPNYKPQINEFTVAQIFFNPKKGSASDAAARAQEVLGKLSAGESFEALANKYNEDSRSNKDGYLGTFKSGDFIPELEKEVARLEVGKTSDVIKSKSGYHIVKVLDKKMTQDPQFLRVKEQIKSMLVEKNFKRQLKNWFESKKQDAYIKIH